MKSLYKKIVAFVAIIGVVALGLSVIKPVSAATVSPTVTNLKAQTNGQKVTFSFDWDLTGKSVKDGDTFTIDAPEGVNITEIATQSLQANGAEVATISMTNKKITFTFKKAIESMNQNVKGGFSYKAEWDSTPGNPGNKTATSKVGSESVVITRPDGPGVFESVLNKYNLTGDFVAKEFKLDASENYAWMKVGDDYYLTKWFIRINGDGKKQAITNPVVSDKIQAPAVDYSKITFAPAANHAANEFFVGTYLKPSFTLRKGGQVIASGWDFWKHVKFDADGNGFTVNLSDVSDVFKTASSDELIVEYQTLIPKTTIRVDNNATLTADEITTPQTDPAFWNNTELKFWVSGDKTVTVQKEWVGDEEADRKDITVQLYADGQALDGLTQTLTKASGWKAEFTKLPGIKDGKKIEAKLEITNINRVTGTILSSEIARAHGEEGLPEDSIKLNFVGSAGQSFGAFLAPGVTMKLEGDSNDYIGKGLSGGKIIVVPRKEAKFVPSENVIIGNVAFYGAIKGEAYIRGTAGERFCVRNSGMTAVVEGIGDHGCEYMTGGCVAVIGKTGRNFAAGMSGGIAYVYNKDGSLDKNCNKELVGLETLSDKDIAKLKEMLENHVKYTGSDVAENMLNNWSEEVKNFVKVIPNDYKKVITVLDEELEKGTDRDEAMLIAFENVTGKKVEIA